LALTRVSPSSWASQQNTIPQINSEMFRLLLDNGADPNISFSLNNGMSLLLALLIGITPVNGELRVMPSNEYDMCKYEIDKSVSYFLSSPSLLFDSIKILPSLSGDDMLTYDIIESDPAHYFHIYILQSGLIYTHENIIKNDINHITDEKKKEAIAKLLESDIIKEAKIKRDFINLLKSSDLESSYNIFKHNKYIFYAEDEYLVKSFTYNNSFLTPVKLFTEALSPLVLTLVERIEKSQNTKLVIDLIKDYPLLFTPGDIICNFSLPKVIEFVEAMPSFFENSIIELYQIKCPFELIHKVISFAKIPLMNIERVWQSINFVNVITPICAAMLQDDVLGIELLLKKVPWILYKPKETYFKGRKIEGITAYDLNFLIKNNTLEKIINKLLLK